MPTRSATADQRPSPAPRVIPSPILRACSALYVRVLARKNRAFDAGRRVVTLDRPVISVGNLSVGGTGKTPMVRWVCTTLIDAGHRPCIAMRGYGTRSAGASDEQAEHRARLPDVPIVAQPDRTSGLFKLFATSAEPIDCVVLDDGFQHRQLARQLDLVLIDASRDPFADAPLPAGWLREPTANLARADAVVVTHAELIDPASLDALCQRVRAQTGSMPIAITRHAWDQLRVCESAGERTEPTAWLAGRRVVAACAIGNPAGFLHQVHQHAQCVGRLVLGDHDPFAPRRIAQLIDLARGSRAEAIVVTEKDWSKLRRVRPSAWPCPVVRAELALRFDQGEGELGELVVASARVTPD